MALTDKFKKLFRQIALGTALLSTSFGYGGNNHVDNETPKKASITQKTQTDFFQKYLELKSDLDMDKNGARYAYEMFIIQNYKNIKKQLEEARRFSEYRFIKTGNYDSSYESVMHNQVDFNQDIQNQYQNLITKQKKGQITETEKKFLLAISAEADLQLKNLLQYADIYPKNNFKIHNSDSYNVYGIEISRY